MATKALGKRTLDARPDRPDMRDRLYAPPLKVLPPSHPPQEWIERYLPAYEKAGLILDQGEEGACTGFGLAALINLPRVPPCLRGVGRRRQAEGAADRQPAHALPPRAGLRRMARRGLRGLELPRCHEGLVPPRRLRGHLWPYRKNGKVVFVPPKEGWTKDAARRPLGAYYRVDLRRHRRHAGGDRRSRRRLCVGRRAYRLGRSGAEAGREGRRPQARGRRAGAEERADDRLEAGAKPNGGHAFALVGYDDEGFIVQNSWGPDWGFHGFARLTYADWLKNGWMPGSRPRRADRRRGADDRPVLGPHGSRQCQGTQSRPCRGHHLARDRRSGGRRRLEPRPRRAARPRSRQ